MMKRIGSRIPRVFFLTVVLVLSGFLTATPVHAQATVVTTNMDIPINLAASVPCAAGGAGEVVFFTGTQHAVFVTVTDANGGVHTQYHFQSQGISGVGLTTGDKYQWTGATHGSYNGQVGFENTFTSTYQVIGPGSGNNLRIHQTFHATVQADGEVTAYVDHYTVTCK